MNSIEKYKLFWLSFGIENISSSNFFVSSRETTSWVDRIKRWPLPKVKYDVIILYPKANHIFSHETSFICQSYRFIYLIVRKHRKRMIWVPRLLTPYSYYLFYRSRTCVNECIDSEFMRTNFDSRSKTIIIHHNHNSECIVTISA